jgi:hypothetical protein
MPFGLYVALSDIPLELQFMSGNYFMTDPKPMINTVKFERYKM